MSEIYLVTGGAGFIGSNFIRFFLNKYPEAKVINFDALTYAGNLRNLDSVSCNPNYIFVKGDVSNPREVADVFEQFNPDYVIHFAAESHVDRSINDSGVFVKTNVLGTQILLDNARTYKVKKYVQISTDEVYGSLGEQGKFSETSPIMPNSPYSASKAAADLLVRAAYKTHGLNVNITRCSNNYGAYQFPEKLIPLMINNAIADKELPVYGDGKNIRDWIYVDDHSRAIELVLHNGEAGEIYNIGAGNEWQNIEIIKYLLKELNKPDSLIEYVTDRPGHDRRYAIDSSKIKDKLGWKPMMDFASGITRTLEWYKTHTEWLQEVVTGEYRNYYKEMYENR